MSNADPSCVPQSCGLSRSVSVSHPADQSDVGGPPTEAARSRWQRRAERRGAEKLVLDIWTSTVIT
jgi:hypothetical protein